MRTIMRGLGDPRTLFCGVLLYSSVVSGAEVADCPRSGKMALANGVIIDVRVVATLKDQVKGLSGVQNKEFGPREAMLFWFEKDGPRKFAMRDIHFDLDMIALDEQLNVLEVRREMKAHPGMSRTPPMDVMAFKPARHVMEIRSDSPYARSIEKGDRLRWVSQPPLGDIGACGIAQDERVLRAKKQAERIPAAPQGR